VVVERVRPEIDCGRVPPKRVVGDHISLDADIFTDGHNAVAGKILYRHGREEAWRRAPMKLVGDNRWRGEFLSSQLGIHQYTVEEGIDSGQDVPTDYLISAKVAVTRAAPEDAAELRDFARGLCQRENGQSALLEDALCEILQQYADRQFTGHFRKALYVVVDREKARLSVGIVVFEPKRQP
jgi:starch synthase (maltosyl-transferring)